MEARPIYIMPNQPRLWHRIALGVVLLIAIVLHFFRLGQEGFANLYYAATVKSMLTSWHNFFFASFDPGGFVAVDKPPLGFWIQAASATLLGFSGVSLLLPQALAGVFSVALLYRLVSRVFGPTAGLAAALVLTVTPISVAANRNNTMDSQLVLTSLLTAWAASVAVERGRLRWLLLCALFVGIGFNIKMLQAVMVLPAFWLVYLVAARTAWWKRILHLALATVVLAVVSLAWVVTVDATPADERPFVGSSRDNTEMELIVGHNGLARLGQIANWLGLRGPAPSRPNVPPGNNPPQPPPNQPEPLYPPPSPNQPGGPPPQGMYGQPLPINPPGQPGGQPGYPLPPQPGQPGGPPQGTYGQPLPINPPGQPGGQPGYPLPLQPGGPLPQNNPPGQPSVPGSDSETGAPGIFRLFNKQLAGQASWLLPLAVLGFVIAALAARWQYPLVREHQQLALWGAWLVPQLVFFSFAGLFHRYYLEMLSPAIAVLAGIGIVAAWRIYSEHRWRGMILPVALLTGAVTEVVILRYWTEWIGWLIPVVIGGSVIVAMALAISRFTRVPGFIRAAAAAIGASVLLTAPTIWSVTPIMGADTALPFAGPELLTRPQRGSVPGNTRLTDFLLAHRNGARFIAATINANSAAPIILATGEPVMAVGGFSGTDNIVSLDRLREFFADNTVRFFVLQPQSNQQEIARWVMANCANVTASVWSSPLAPRNAPPIPEGEQQLYDCARK
jgi:4-amino-4-deoxy-L-arabinose transferase-like glycosyltransferase